MDRWMKYVPLQTAGAICKRPEKGIAMEMELGECIQVWTSKITVSLQGEYVRNGTPNGRPAYIHDYYTNLFVVVAGSFQVFGAYFIPEGAGMSNKRWDMDTGLGPEWHAQIFIWFICLIST